MSIEVLAACCSAASIAAFVSALPRSARLADRLAPYLPLGPGEQPIRRARRRLLGSIGAFVEGSGERALSRKLQQAGVLASVEPGQRIEAYRARVGLTTLGAATAGLLLGQIVGLAGPIGVLPAALGGIAGASFWRGRLDRAISARRALARIELYTVNQLLAMHVRAGSGVVAAVRRVVDSGNGVVVGELADALRLHWAGLSAADAFLRVAAGTAEPHTARMLRALATAEKQGSDVARALLALSEDVRDGRREAIRRRATRRRAAMLLPVLGLLAPTLVLFVAAPLPWLVLRGFGTV